MAGIAALGRRFHGGMLPREQIARYLLQPWRSLYSELAAMEVIDLAARLTLVLLIVYGTDHWYMRIPIRILCAAGVLAPSLQRSSVFWFIVTAVLAFGVSYNWYDMDNHKYLMAYWCLAISMSLRAPNPAKALATNARLLIGLCFLFAVLWKAFLSSDFVDGSFFQFTLLTDSRFRRFASFLGGMTDDMRLKNLHLLGHLRSGGTDAGFVQLAYPSSLVRLAQVMTWGTLFIESAIAISFLGPQRFFPPRARHAALLTFAAGTYLVATVAGFGWLLMVMGCAQCEPESRKTRIAYITVFFLIQVYTAPLGSLLLSV